MIKISKFSLQQSLIFNKFLNPGNFYSQTFFYFFAMFYIEKMFTIKKEDGHEALSMPSTYKKSPREPKNPETL